MTIIVTPWHLCKLVQHVKYIIFLLTVAEGTSFCHLSALHASVLFIELVNTNVHPKQFFSWFLGSFVIKLSIGSDNVTVHETPTSNCIFETVVNSILPEDESYSSPPSWFSLLYYTDPLSQYPLLSCTQSECDQFLHVPSSDSFSCMQNFTE